MFNHEYEAFNERGIGNGDGEGSGGERKKIAKERGVRGRKKEAAREIERRRGERER